MDQILALLAQIKTSAEHDELTLAGELSDRLCDCAYFAGLAEKALGEIEAAKVRPMRGPISGKRLGGIARAEKLSPERRQEIARLGAAARWSKAS